MAQKIKTNHGGTRSPSMAGGTAAIPHPTKTPQRAVAKSARTSTSKAITQGAGSFPSPYAGAAVPLELHTHDLPAMKPYAAAEQFAPSDAHPVRLRHRMGGEG